MIVLVWKFEFPRTYLATLVWWLFWKFHIHTTIHTPNLS